MALSTSVAVCYSHKIFIFGAILDVTFYHVRRYAGTRRPRPSQIFSRTGHSYETLKRNGVFTRSSKRTANFQQCIQNTRANAGRLPDRVNTLKVDITLYSDLQPPSNSFVVAPATSFTNLLVIDISLLSSASS